MVDMTLTASTALGGYHQDYGHVVLSEVSDKALVSIAIPAGNEKKLATALSKAYKAAVPKIGAVTTSEDGSADLLGMQIDQLFMVFDHSGDSPLNDVAKQLDDVGYYTDQSDGWVLMNISGDGSRAALERICMIDLHASAFPPGSLARTNMEHLGVTIYFKGGDSFMIMTARSSAHSLLHALEISIQNIT